MSHEIAPWAHGGGPRRKNVWRAFWSDARTIARTATWSGPEGAERPLRGRAVTPHATAPLSLRGKFHPDGAGLGEHLLGRGPLVIVANMADAEDPARVLAALPIERRRHTLVVLRRPTLKQVLRLPVAEVNMDRPRIGGGRLVGWLRRGGTVLVFPEAGPSTDGDLGGFHPFGVELAVRADVPVAPAAVQGSFAGEQEPVVRFGAPIDTDPHDTAPGRTRAAVASLLAEGSTSWWAELTSADTPAPTGATWQRIWGNSAPRADAARPPIWRS